MKKRYTYTKEFIPYALAAYFIGIAGDFSTVLGPSFVRDTGIAYTTGQILTVSGGFGLATPVYGDLSNKTNRR